MTPNSNQIPDVLVGDGNSRWVWGERGKRRPECPWVSEQQGWVAQAWSWGYVNFVNISPQIMIIGLLCSVSVGVCVSCSGQLIRRTPIFPLTCYVVGGAFNAMGVVDLLVGWYVWGCSLEYSKKLKFWWRRSFWWSRRFLRFMERQGGLLVVLGKKC